MIFSNELKAYNKYVAYAMSKGFGVRKGNLARNSKGEIIRRTFVCNCEGYSASSIDDEKKFERFEVRCGWLAHIKFKVDDGIFEVIEYIFDHNYAFIPENQRHLIRCGRIMSETCNGVLTDMVKAGIRETSAYKFLANEAGGSKNLGFNLRDCQNYLQTKKSEIIIGGDCQNLLNHFHSMEQQNPMFSSYAIQVDKDGRLTNIFWRDSLSKFDYDCFGDVLIFDTTYRTNIYEMICAPFVGVNHHWKNVLFGCAFLLDETAESFIWLFDAFLKSMGNKAPKTIFTNQDQAMAKAIRTIFPNTHRLCTWHIGKNANQNIPHLYKKPGFKDKYFSALMYRCRSNDEFEFIWREMEKEWGTENNSWLRKLYGIRHKWSLAFGRDIFTCGILSSQKSESTNNVFQNIARKTSTLIEFVHYYEEQVKHMREIKSQYDYSCRGKAKAAVPHDILKHAASVYTRAIFKKFNDEFTQILSENISGSTFDGFIYSFTLKCRGSQREHIVQIDPVDFSVSCECKSFESKGWLCRHALKVLSENISVTSIPSAYILKRWTKCAKQGIENDEFHHLSADSSKFNRFSALMQQSFELMSLGAEDENTIKIVGNSMEKAKAKISLYKSSADETDDVSGNDDEASLCNISVLDPLRKKGK
ncbi:hypothetical protein BT93_H1645 [Corymbia citriodora subsp. variegata]|nr:hypothetical protein BT93_H1645 [Corymbia citriodora subsp. variegata]